MERRLPTARDVFRLSGRLERGGTSPPQGAGARRLGL